MFRGGAWQVDGVVAFLHAASRLAGVRTYRREPAHAEIGNAVVQISYRAFLKSCCNTQVDGVVAFLDAAARTCVGWSEMLAQVNPFNPVRRSVQPNSKPLNP